MLNLLGYELYAICTICYLFLKVLLGLICLNAKNLSLLSLLSSLGVVILDATIVRSCKGCLQWLSYTFSQTVVLCKGSLLMKLQWLSLPIL